MTGPPHRMWRAERCVHRRGNVESLAYLVDRMPANTTDALNQRLFVMDMCPTLVRYVVEEQRLNDTGHCTTGTTSKPGALKITRAPGRSTTPNAR